MTARDFRDVAEGGGFFFQSKSQQTAESYLLKYLATVAYIFLQDFSSPFPLRNSREEQLQLGSAMHVNARAALMSQKTGTGGAIS